MFEDLRCPYCGYESEPCDFPACYFYGVFTEVGVQRL